MGRRDNQVKVRGYRVELGEIEQSLRACEGIEEAVVILGDTSGTQQELVAYLAGKKQWTSGDLRRYLKERLPDYMVPGYYVQLDKLPLTQNGKIDKRSLPRPQGMEMNTGTTCVAPRNSTEEKLVEIWSNVLGIEKEKIGINDNFFERGGHSLKATRLSSQIYKEFSIKISLRDIFLHPTIEGIANAIQTLQWLRQADNNKPIDSSAKESLIF